MAKRRLHHVLSNGIIGQEMWAVFSFIASGHPLWCIEDALGKASLRHQIRDGQQLWSRSSWLQWWNLNKPANASNIQQIRRQHHSTKLPRLANLPTIHQAKLMSKTQEPEAASRRVRWIWEVRFLERIRRTPDPFHIQGPLTCANEQRSFAIRGQSKQLRVASAEPITKRGSIEFKMPRLPSGSFHATLFRIRTASPASERERCHHRCHRKSSMSWKPPKLILKTKCIR